MTRILAALLFVLPTTASAATLCVNTAGSGGCFATIQQAVNATTNGASIDVAAGTYAENVVIGPRKKLSIVGAGPGTTIVDGGGSGAGLHLMGASTVLLASGLSVQNGTPGIDVDPQARLMASNCSVTGSTPGISGGSKANVIVSGCDISGNFATDPSFGGGIRVTGVGKLTVAASTVSGNSGRGIQTYALKLTDSTISGNTGGGIMLFKGSVAGSTISGNSTAGAGGGVETFTVSSTITISNSTISGNSAGVGGGIFSEQPMQLEHVTIAGNAATIRGGGLDFEVVGAPSRKITLKATIIADNTAPTGPDCFSAMVRSSGTNLVEDTSACTITPLGGATLISADPLLGSLQNNGGATETKALLPGSPAIGAVTAGTLCRKPDQRGVARSVPCDVGAFEAP